MSCTYARVRKCSVLRAALAVALVLGLTLATPSAWITSAVAASALDALLSELDRKITASNAILMEPTTGKIAWERAADTPRPIASVVKIMTLTLVMEAIDKGQIHLDDIVVTSEHVASMGGSQIWLEVGEAMAVSELIKAVAIESANDAAVALAEHVAGSETGFVALMNERAREIGCKNTNFINATGLPGPGNTDCMSSAKDVALMSRELLRYPKIHQWLSVWIGDVRGGKNVLTNTNRLIRFYPGADGIKTGYTERARYCLSATALRNGVRVVAVVLGMPTSAQRFAEVSTMLDYGFRVFEANKVAATGQQVATLPVHRGLETEVKIEPVSDLNVVGFRGEAGNIEAALDLPQHMQAPVHKGQVVGRIRAIVDGTMVSEVDLVASDDVARAPMFKLLRRHTRMLLRAVFRLGEARNVYGG